MNQTNQPAPGIYRHYKGALYEVLHVAQHSEDESWFVVYRALYGEYGVWVRPLELFNQPVEQDGEFKARFQLEKAFH